MAMQEARRRFTVREYDRTVKLSQYARANIPEVWLADVKVESVERHSRPKGGRYRAVARLRRGQLLVSATIPNLALAIDDIFGRPAATGYE